MKEFALIIALAILVEFIVEILKKIFPNSIKGVSLSPYYAVAVGVTLAFVTQVDLFKQLGFDITNSYVSLTFSGFIYSGGSRAVHTLLAKLQNQDESNYKKDVLDYATEAVQKVILEFDNTIIKDLKEMGAFTDSKKLEMKDLAVMRVESIIPDEIYNALEKYTGSAEDWISITIEEFVTLLKKDKEVKE
jgi:hypothetical protein